MRIVTAGKLATTVVVVLAIVARYEVALLKTCQRFLRRAPWTSVGQARHPSEARLVGAGRERPAHGRIVLIILSGQVDCRGGHRESFDGLRIVELDVRILVQGV